MASHFAKLNATITDADLNVAWQDRSEDAAALDAGGRHAAAIAARLYAQEIYLKFRICRRLRLSNPPKKLEIHNLDALIVFSGLSRDLEALPKAGDVYQNSIKILEYSKDLNDLQYLPDSRWPRQHSEELSRWLLDPSTGLLPWQQNQK
jgi:hypothetical protein